MVVVEGRRPSCWACKEIGHIAKFCPQKAESTTATTTTATTTTISKQAEAQGPGQGQPKTSDQEGWTEVTRKRKGPLNKGKMFLRYIHPQKQTKAPAAAAVPESLGTPEPIKTPASPKVPATPKTPATPATPVKSASPASPTPRKSHKKKINRRNTNGNKRQLEEEKGQWGRGRQKIFPEKSHPMAGPSSQTKPQPPPPSPPLPLPLPPPPFPPPKILLQSPPQQMDPLSPQQEQYLQKQRRPYKIPLPRSQSAERAQPSSLVRTPSLPSLSPSDFQSQELFPAIFSSHKGKTDPTAGKKPSQQEEELSIGQIQRAAALCSVELEAGGDFQLRKALKPLLSFEKVNNVNISNPSNFRSAAMVNTFVRLAGDRTRGVWKFLSTVCQTDTGMKLAELEHSSVKSCISYCSGRVPILVHPSLYRSIKLQFPIDVRGITRDNRVTTELSTGSLRLAVGILTPKDFRPIVASE